MFPFTRHFGYIFHVKIYKTIYSVRFVYTTIPFVLRFIRFI